MKTDTIGKIILTELLNGFLMGIEIIDAISTIYGNQENQEEQHKEESTPYFSDFEVVDEKPKELSS